MNEWPEIRAGVSLSLSGPFRLQGEQAQNGFRLWVDYVTQVGGLPPGLAGPRRPIRLLILDDRSRTSFAKENVLRFLAQDPAVARISVVYAKTGSFAADVARGVAEAAKAAGFDAIGLVPFDSPILDARAVFREALAAKPDLLVGAGSFQDDVTIVRCRDLASHVKTLAFVGAGLEAFCSEVGALAEGVIGPSQWEPAADDAPLMGPNSEWFSSAFHARFHQRPEYPAAQAFAIGVVVGECLRRAGSLEDEPLLREARALETTTLYGGFRLHQSTAHQIGHRVHLVQWRGGRKVVIAR